MFRTLAALATLFVMTGCAADFAEDSRPESTTPAEDHDQNAEGEDTDDAKEVETDRVAPMKKQIVCKKASDC